MTFDEILRREPRLRPLLERARRLQPATWRDFADLKREADLLVGHGRIDDRHPELRTPLAWDLTVGALLTACEL